MLAIKGNKLLFQKLESHELTLIDIGQEPQVIGTKPMTGRVQLSTATQDYAILVLDQCLLQVVDLSKLHTVKLLKVATLL